MILRSIHAYDFVQYPEIRLEGIPKRGTIGIFGKNEYGKSTLADAISFALFGETPRANVKGHIREFSKADYVRWGASLAWVGVRFEINGRLYEVSRSVSLSGRTKAEINDVVSGEIIASGVREVDDYIQNVLLGYGFQEYRYSSYVAQKEIDLLTKNETDVRAVINHMLGIDLLGEARKRCEQERKRWNDDLLPERKQRLELVLERLREKESRVEEAGLLKEELARLNEEIRAVEAVLEEKERLRDELSELREVEARREKLSAVLDEKLKQAEALSAQIKKAEEAAEKLSFLKEQISDEDKRSLLEKEEDYRISLQLLDKVDRLSDRIDYLSDRLAQIEKKLGALYDKKRSLDEEIVRLRETEGVPSVVGALRRLRSVYDFVERFVGNLEKEREEVVRRGDRARARLEKVPHHVVKGDLEGRERKIKNTIYQLRARRENLAQQIDFKRSRASALNMGAVGLFAVGILFLFLSLGILSVLFAVSGLALLVMAQRAKGDIPLLEEERERVSDQISRLVEDKGRVEALRRHRESVEENIAAIRNEIEECERMVEIIDLTLRSFQNFSEMKVYEVLQLAPRVHDKISEVLRELEGVDFGEYKYKTVREALYDLERYDAILDERKKSQARVEDLSKDVKEIGDVEAEREDVEKELSSLKKESEEAFKVLREKLDALGIPLDPDVDVWGLVEEGLKRIEEIKKEMSRNEGSISELEKLAGSLPDLREKFEVLSGEIEGIKDQLSELPEENVFDPEFFESLEKEIESLRDKAVKLKERKGNLKGSIREKLGSEEEAKNILDAVNRAERLVKEAETFVMYYRELKKEFKELQEDIRKEITPQIRQYLSWILPRITDDRYKMVRIGGDFKMEVFSEDKGDFVNITCLSGGTIDQLLLSLRLGFARALNSANSKDNELFIFLDEPFSSFDSGRRDAFIDFIKNFETTFQQIFLISHIDGLENYVDYYIKVEKDAAGHSYLIPSWMD